MNYNCVLITNIIFAKWPKDKNGKYKPGLNGYANGQLLCKKCNSKKHAKNKE